MSILITGATGFIGGHLIKAIGADPGLASADIILLSSKPIEGYRTIEHKQYTFTKEDFIAAGIDSIDTVIHLGAFIPKKSSEANNIQDCNSNILSLAHLIKELPSTPGKFIFISTADVYASGVDKMITERTPAEPATLYGWSKLYGEKMLEAWAKKENVILQVLRMGHIYGSGEERFEKIIPVTIRKALQKESPVIFTEGDEIRSFLHVSDAVKAIMASLQLTEYAGPINVVSARPLSIKQIVQLIVDKVSPGLAITVQGNNAPVKDLVFDNKKMQEHLIVEKVSFEEGIEEEINSSRL